MTNWKEYKLGKSCSKIGSGSTPRGGGNAYKLEGISLIRSQNVLDLNFTYDGLALIDDEQADELKNVIVQQNDILLNITGDSVARVCKVPKEVLPARVNQHVMIIRPDEKVIRNDYLLYYLQAKKAYLLSIAEIGGTRNALTKGMIENLEILAPNPNEQSTIASILSSLDDKIDLLHRQNKTLEQLAETLFRQWFVEEAEMTSSLEDLIWFDPREKMDKGKQYQVFDMKCLSTTDMNLSEGIIRDVTSATTFRNGDTLLAKITPCLENGKTGFVMLLGDNEIAKGSTEFIVMRTKGQVSPYWIYCLARSKDFHDSAILSMTGTSGRQRVQIGLLKGYQVNAEQKRMKVFHENVEPYFLKIKSNTTQIRTLTQLRDTLLPKLMSGEVRVNEN